MRRELTGYVVDHSATTAGLTDGGSESQRRALSKYVHAAANGGPRLAFPAICLAATAEVRPAIADHVAMLVADAPRGTIEVSRLTRGPQLEVLREQFPGLDWPAAHAVLQALLNDEPIMTAETTAYAGVPVEILAL